MFSARKAQLIPLTYLINHHVVSGVIAKTKPDPTQYPESPLAYTGKFSGIAVTKDMVKDQRLSSINPFNFGGLI